MNVWFSGRTNETSIGPWSCADFFCTILFNDSHKILSVKYEKIKLFIIGHKSKSYVYYINPIVDITCKIKTITMFIAGFNPNVCYPSNSMSMSSIEAIALEHAKALKDPMMVLFIYAYFHYN